MAKSGCVGVRRRKSNRRAAFGARFGGGRGRRGGRRGTKVRRRWASGSARARSHDHETPTVGDSGTPVGSWSHRDHNSPGVERWRGRVADRGRRTTTRRQPLAIVARRIPRRRPGRPGRCGHRAPARCRHRTRGSWRRDSNPQPADYKSAALPVELRQRVSKVAPRGPGVSPRPRRSHAASSILEVSPLPRRSRAPSPTWGQSPGSKKSCPLSVPGAVPGVSPPPP